MSGPRPLLLLHRYGGGVGEGGAGLLVARGDTTALLLMQAYDEALAKGVSSPRRR